MAKPVTKLKIFVASPDDVQAERELLDDVIDELNRGIADERGLVLELVRWETHAWPAIGEDAQDVINRQIAPGDVFVGIMWNRFGTPTKRAESGTKEEFDRAYACWKEYGRPKIMFYFNCAPFSPSSEDELEQKRKVLDFKKELSNKGALYWDYADLYEFERKVRQHLTQEIRRWGKETKHPQRSGTVKDMQVRREILELLYEASSSTPSRMSFGTLVERLDTSPEATQFHLNYLEKKRWVTLSRRTLGARIIRYYSITPEGIDSVERGLV